MASPKFFLNASPSSDGGFVMLGGATATVTLESTADVYSWSIAVVQRSKSTVGNPPVFVPGSGVAATPSSGVTFTPVDVGKAASYMVTVTVNTGTDTAGNVHADWSYTRIIRVLSPTMLIGAGLISERQEFDLTYGWSSANEDLVQAAELANSPPEVAYAVDNPTPQVGKQNIFQAGITVATFPLASTWTGRMLWVKNYGTAGNVVISRAGGDLIDGAATSTLTGAYGGGVYRAVSGARILRIATV